MLKLVGLLAALGITLGLPASPNVADIGPRIVGGEETDIEHNPWQLALLYYSQHFCGAVEIHPSWALTAAHCLEGVVVDHLSVRAGSTTKSFGGQVVDVRTIYIHPDFNRRTIDYDFGLLRLQEPISIQTSAPVALPGPLQEIVIGATATITGWGTVSSEGAAPEILRVVHVPILGHEYCQFAHRHNVLTDRMFCAGDYDEGGRDSCRGDAGGPVLVDGQLAGLVSWGSGCGRAHSPGVNAKVASVVGWIYQTSGV